MKQRTFPERSPRNKWKHPTQFRLKPCQRRIYCTCRLHPYRPTTCPRGMRCRKRSSTLVRRCLLNKTRKFLHLRTNSCLRCTQRTLSCRCCALFPPHTLCTNLGQQKNCKCLWGNRHTTFRQSAQPKRCICLQRISCISRCRWYHLELSMNLQGRGRSSLSLKEKKTCHRGRPCTCRPRRHPRIFRLCRGHR